MENRVLLSDKFELWMVVEPNTPLLAAAPELDAKLQALAAKVTATKATGRKASMHSF